MNKHDAVVPSSRLEVVLLSIITSLKVSGLQWYVDDSPHLGHFTVSVLQARWVKTVKVRLWVAKPTRIRPSVAYRGDPVK